MSGLRVFASVLMCLGVSVADAAGQRLSRPNSPDVVELPDGPSVARIVSQAAKATGKPVVVAAVSNWREVGTEVGRNLAGMGRYTVVFIAVAGERVEIQQRWDRLRLPKPYYLLTGDAGSTLPQLVSEPIFYVFSADAQYLGDYRGDNSWRFYADRNASGETLEGELDARGAIEATRFWAARAAGLTGIDAVVRDIRLAQVAFQESRLPTHAQARVSGDPILVRDLEAFLVHPSGNIRIPVRLSGSFEGTTLAVRSVVAR